MYPLNMSNRAVGGFAVANDEQEHKTLTEMGYEPAYVEQDQAEEPAKRGPGRPKKQQ